ncbi:hypothetical protein [Cellvibrio sp. PSBB023]|uniref:phage tail terminator protein n=1 Tax=Cellvibrio sp. PSBB023 TaxID=1945512 RepID=UPI00098F2ED1|nr:hypothetical protein [Cellvibrio sp. PSBB023]AQT58720.1 hypothetical protein B0D95_00395 [Cellvibrio sp. PSBB023]
MDFFDSQLIIEHLKDPAFGFEKVEGAAEYAAVEKIGSFRHNTLYVVVSRERNKSPGKSAVSKRAIAEVNFGIISVGRNYRDATGAAALQDIGPVIGRVRKAILGWTPAGCLEACQWLEGYVQDYDKTNLLWVDVFTTSYTIGN